MDRRQFIKNSTWLAVGTAMVPQFLASCNIERQAFKGKRVVLIHLEGGNDGLSTFVPYRNDHYYRYRPTLGIAPERIVPLTDEIGIPDYGSAMARLFLDGDMAVYNNVGALEPNTSHFKSTDIWYSGWLPSEQKPYDTGWVGRFLDREKHADVPISALGIEVRNTFSLLLKGKQVCGANLEFIEHFARFEAHEPAYDFSCDGDHPVAQYMEKVWSEAVFSAKALSAWYEPSRFDYPETPLATDLRRVAGCIKNGAPSIFYFVRQGGYDTHLGQSKRHPKLIGELGHALAAFVQDLKGAGLFEDTLIFVFSEFGRRAKENVNYGTDHGVGNNVVLLSGALKRQGILNEPPDLETLAYRQDVAVNLDFRQIYATILERWLEVPADQILGARFPLLDFV